MGPIRMVVPQAPPSLGGVAADIRFLDRDGRPVGRRRRVAVPPPPLLEAPASGGAISHEAANPLIAFMTRLPAGAKAFRIEQQGHDAILASILETASPRPTRPRSRRRFGSANARFVLAVLAERYGN